MKSPVEVEVPTKRTRRVAQKKVESSVKVAMKKKFVPSVVDADLMPFIDHLVIDIEFLREHVLDQVVVLLEKQGWAKFFLVNSMLNKELARKIFSTLIISN